MVDDDFDARPDDWLYQKAVSLVVVNPKDSILILECEGKKDIFRMPQGEIEVDEPPIEAAFRILFEDAGITDVTEAYQKHFQSHYEYPPNLNYNRNFRGQSFTWFLMRTGEFAEAECLRFAHDVDHPDFKLLRWVTPQDVIRLAHNDYAGDAITAQRQEMYRMAFREFGLLSFALEEKRPQAEGLRRKRRKAKRTDAPDKDGYVDVSAKSMIRFNDCLIQILVFSPENIVPQVQKLESALDKALEKRILYMLGVRTEVITDLNYANRAFREIDPDNLENFLDNYPIRFNFLKLAREDILSRAKEVVASVNASEMSSYIFPLDDGYVDVSASSMVTVSTFLAQLSEHVPQKLSHGLQKLENAVDTALVKHLMARLGVRVDVVGALETVKLAYKEICKRPLSGVYRTKAFMRMVTKDINKRTKEVVPDMPAPKRRSSRNVRKFRSTPKTH